MPAQTVARTTTKIRARRAAAAALLLLAACAGLSTEVAGPQSAAAAGAPAVLHVVQNGPGSVRVEGPGQPPQECFEGFYPAELCEYTGFTQGDVVTLTAISAETTSFTGWSDDRCPAGPVRTCTLTLDSEQSVVALFSPLSLTVRTNYPAEPLEAYDQGVVTITPAGGPQCTAIDNGLLNECGPYPLFSVLAVTATGNAPQWDPDHCTGPVQTGGQGANATATCTVVLLGNQHVGVGFSGAGPPLLVPGRVDVTFRVRTRGSGSGTVKGPGIDCGTDCSTKVRFGDPVTLLAVADEGSRFVRWRGGCGTSAKCPLQANDTTPSAEFERLARSSERAPKGQAPPRASARRARFSARVGKITTSGRGSRRRIRIPVAVSAAAGAHARLVRDGRRVASLKRSVAPGGTRILRLRVPSRARSGRYVLKLTIRASDGSGSVRVQRRVRVRR